jgi:hypothetical protein
LLLPSPDLASRTIAWYMTSKLTAGVPQMTASTARLSMVRRARLSEEKVWTSADAAGATPVLFIALSFAHSFFKQAVFSQRSPIDPFLSAQ